MRAEIASYFFLGCAQGTLKLSHPIKAFAYYRDYSLNLLTGKKEYKKAEDFFLELHKLPLDNFPFKRVIHLFYEAGYLIKDLLPLIQAQDILAIDIEYAQDEVLLEKKIYSSQIGIKSLQSPNRQKYRDDFLKIREQLVAGNCYQANLTIEALYQLEMEGTNDELWHSVKKAPYSHMTVIPLLQKTFLSFSPECLFQTKKMPSGLKLWSMPIKGTVRREGSVKSDFSKLLRSRKDRCELFMIIDLLKNDLSSIERPHAKVIKKRSPLVLPEIIHQYALIEVDLSDKVSLGQIIFSIFPGGSITGAPKKRVLEIIKKTEKRRRGFYCGSTLFRSKNGVAASINIRSFELDHLSNKVGIQAGGGITIQSQFAQEFDEILAKLASVTDYCK